MVRSTGVAIRTTGFFFFFLLLSGYHMTLHKFLPVMTSGKFLSFSFLFCKAGVVRGQHQTSSRTQTKKIKNN